MSKSIDDLDYLAERAARSMLLEAHAHGLSPLVTSTLRTEDEQVATWAQGRGTLDLVNLLRQRAAMKPIPQNENYIVTKCDGVNTPSSHQSGKALDVVLLDKFGNAIWTVAKNAEGYRKLGAIGKGQGFKWGGDFEPLDPVTGIGWDPFHYEIK